MYVVLLAIRFYGIRYEVMMMMVVRGFKIVEVVDQLLQFLVFCIIAHVEKFLWKFSAIFLRRDS